jgi:hypothetical protein
MSILNIICTPNNWDIISMPEPSHFFFLVSSYTWRQGGAEVVRERKKRRRTRAWRTASVTLDKAAAPSITCHFPPRNATFHLKITPAPDWTLGNAAMESSEFKRFAGALDKLQIGCRREWLGGQICGQMLVMDWANVLPAMSCLNTESPPGEA